MTNRKRTLVFLKKSTVVSMMRKLLHRTGKGYCLINVLNEYLI